jgi:hypothetical protein
MTWAAWRVQRPQLLAATIALCALTLWLSVTGIAMGHSQTWKYWTDGAIYVLLVLPGALGLALGAPLVASELEHGTHRLAWTQSVTRARWLTGKLLVGGVATAVLVVLLTLFLEWWTGAVSVSAMSQSGGFNGVHIGPTGFDLTGIVVVGYTLFAFFLGTALGALLRRPGWAFAVGLPIFGAIRIGVQEWLRPSLISPVTATTLQERAPAAAANSWMLHFALLPANRLAPPPGQTWGWWDSSSIYNNCDDRAASDAASAHCAVLAHVHFVWQYQPESHYWALQGIETAIFLGLGLLLLGVAITAIRHRRDA